MVEFGLHLGASADPVGDQIDGSMNSTFPKRPCGGDDDDETFLKHS